ncbi:DUF2490 domain-containing protein [Pontimicrobium sp. MEBiC06410]
MKKYCLIILIILISIKNYSQVKYQIGSLPSFNINTSLKNNWKLNLKTEFRQLFKTGVFNGESINKYEYIHTDLALNISKKVGLNNTIGAGFLLRITDEEVKQRALQQFTLVSNYSTFKLAHRIRTDQTFSKTEPTEIRIRYRITFNKALNGLTVDSKEFYLKLNHEYVNSFTGNLYDLEYRINPNLGYVFSDDNKIELGIEYRNDGFVNNENRSRFFAVINWYVSL